MAALALLAFFGVFLAWPLFHVAAQALADGRGLTAFYVISVFSSPDVIEAVLRSSLIAVLTTAGCLLLAMPTAWLFCRREFPGKALLGGALLLPMILPPFVGAAGIKALLGRSGAFSELMNVLGLAQGPVDLIGAFPLAGVVLLEVLHLYPVMHLNLLASLGNVDPSLEEAAASMGASPWRTLRRVSLPLAFPGVFAGAILVFIWSFTELGTPLVFGVRGVLPVMIYDGVAEIGTNPAGHALVLFVLVVTALSFWAGKRLLRREKAYATLGRMASARKDRRLTGFPLLFAWAGLGLLLTLSLLPHLGTVMLASSGLWFETVLPQGITVKYYREALGSGLAGTSLLNSMVLSLCSTGMDVILGFGVAWLCVRRRVRFSGALDSLAMLPMAVPGLVIAFGYIGCFSGAFPGSWIDPRMNPMPLLAVSYCVRRLPYMVRAAHSGLEQVSPVYEEAAANLGATPLRVVLRITIPLVFANLMAGAILCFAFSMLEVSDSLILAQSEEFYPITKAIYVLLDSLDNGLNVAAALGSWATALVGAAILFAAAIMGRRVGSMFRAG